MGWRPRPGRVRSRSGARRTRMWPSWARRGPWRRCTRCWLRCAGATRPSGRCRRCAAASLCFPLQGKKGRIGCASWPGMQSAERVTRSGASACGQAAQQLACGLAARMAGALAAGAGALEAQVQQAAQPPLPGPFLLGPVPAAAAAAQHAQPLSSVSTPGKPPAASEPAPAQPTAAVTPGQEVLLTLRPLLPVDCYYMP